MKKIQMAVIGVLVLASSSAFAADREVNAGGDAGCTGLPTFAQLQTALAASVASGGGGSLAANANGGLNFPMWATLVNSSGRVCAVAKVGSTDPWPGSRVISAQKAYTANAFSNEKLALSTANLFTAVQPGGSLYGLQHSNPVNPLFAYAGNSALFGTATDPLVGKRVGGINVFGGGLALYNSAGKVIGAIGVSGDTSCADHNIAWRLRGALAALGTSVVAKVPGGVNTAASASNSAAAAADTSKGDDNIIFPSGVGTGADTTAVAAGTFQHTKGCLAAINPLTANVTNF